MRLQVRQVHKRRTGDGFIRWRSFLGRQQIGEIQRWPNGEFSYSTPKKDHNKRFKKFETCCQCQQESIKWWLYSMGVDV